MIRGSLVPSLKQAGRFLKRVEHQGFEWAAEVRDLPRQALKQVLEQQIRDRIVNDMVFEAKRAAKEQFFQEILQTYEVVVDAEVQRIVEGGEK